MLLSAGISSMLLLAAAPPRAAMVMRDDALATLGGALAKISDSRQSSWRKLNSPGFLLLPPTSTPWAAVHFVGGAGFGTAPQICYDSLLSSLVERTGVAVIATPFDLGTDHNLLAAKVHRDFDSGLAECIETYGLASAAPVYRIGHSLGAKLCVIGALREGGSEGGGGGNAPPLGLLAFNNFGLADSAALAAELFDQFQGGAGRNGETMRAVLDAFSVVQQVATATGAGSNFEVSPSPQELESSVRASYSAPRTHVWRMGDDRLDSSDGLLACMPSAAEHVRTVLADVTHLAPVAFRLEAGEIDPALELLLGSGQGFTFGDKVASGAVCDALCEFIWPSAMAARALTGGEASNGDDAADDDQSGDALPEIEVLTD